MNAIDNSNIDIARDSKDTIKCGLLPSSVEDQLNGTWYGHIISTEPQKASIIHESSQAIIKPPNSYSIYKWRGHCIVECIFANRYDNTTIFTFKKTIRIQGKLISLLSSYFSPFFLIILTFKSIG
ncbi:unnamed protein product [Trichobilharzia regenti]|nr:unnamed protein product [Trichobilharzia regenti]